MNKRYKKLLELNNALNIALKDSSVIKNSSLKREVDINSYSRKVIGLFFPFIAEKLNLLSKEHESKLEISNNKIDNAKAKMEEIEEEALRIGSPWGMRSFSDVMRLESNDKIPKKDINKISILEDQYYQLSNSIWDISPDISNWINAILKIYLHPNKVIGKIEVFYEGPEKSSKKIKIDEKDFDIFSQKEQEIFLRNTQVFNIHLRSEDREDELITGGAITGRSNFIVYNPTIYYDKSDPKVLIRNIEKLYQTIIELIAHESSHNQQFNLEQDAIRKMLNMRLDDEDMWSVVAPLITEKGYVRSKDRKEMEKWLKSKGIGIAGTESKNDEWGISKSPVMMPEDPYLTPESQSIAKKNELERKKSDIKAHMSGCPEQMLFALKEIELNPDVRYLDLVDKYMEKCKNESMFHNAEDISREYHKNIMKEDEWERQKEDYYLRPVEIEAHIRGARSELRITRKTMAEYFCTNIAYQFSNKNLVKNIWNEYKSMYRDLNYPEKDLGSDEDAIQCTKVKNPAPTRKSFGWGEPIGPRTYK